MLIYVCKGTGTKEADRKETNVRFNRQSHKQWEGLTKAQSPPEEMEVWSWKHETLMTHAHRGTSLAYGCGQNNGDL